MKKTKAANKNSELPRTPKDAMAPAEPLPVPQKTDMEKMQDGNYDLDHLLKAEDIKADPEKMNWVQKAHDKKSTAMRSIADLKMASQALAQQAGAKGPKTAEMAPTGIAAQPRNKTRYPARS